MLKLFSKNNKEKFLIVGLGNPETKYFETRHNTGFMFIDELAREMGIEVNIKKHRSLIGTKIIDGKKIILCKPLTYMNNSGEAIRKIVDFEKINPETNILVVLDDIHLAVGKTRFKEKGSSGGHNGLKNIEMHLGTSNYPRLRIGVGETPKGEDQISHVLGKFSKDERIEIDKAISDTINIIEKIYNKDFEYSMNILNAR